jgi:EAL domain-containing protein (putative c-di-GMP-specific phosphodiesterase class I)
MHENALERLELETALRDVVASNGLEMYLQQQLNISSGALVGFEALARWNHPSLGAISPEKFIPIAEETRLIFDIGAWILEEACRALRDWRERGLPPISMAVNVSPVQLASQGFVEVVTRCIADFDVQPGELELEITESAMTNDVNDAIETLQTLRSLGVRISIDDFGTGYSGLARLQRLPIDRVKIDKSFVAGLNLDLGTDPQSSKLVQAIVTMAETFELDVVAEGVETTQQAEMLSAIGCDIAQGYLYHRPSSARSAMDTAAERVLS